MNLRATLALGLIAAGLGLYVYLVEVRGERERQAQETEARRLLALNADEITALEVPLKGGGQAKLVRKPADDSSDWVLEAPLRFPADASFVASLLSTLAGLESERVIEDPPEDLAVFGLGEARRPVRVWTGEGQPTVLYLGGDTPVNAQLYLALEGRDGEIYTVARGRASALEPRLRDLRDRRLVAFAVDDVERLRVQEHGSLVAEVERKPEAEGGGWRVVAPREDLADADRIERALQDLTLARATDFVDEPGELGEYGLDAPELELSIETASGTEQVLIGRVQDKGFVRVGQSETLYETSDRVLMNVPRSLFAFRYKRVLKLDSDSVQRIELSFPREPAAYAFVREEGAWRADDPETQVKSLSVEDVRYALEDLQATGIVEPARELAALGLDPPRVRVRALDGAGVEFGWLELGDPGPQTDLAARSSVNDRVWRVDSDLGVDVPLSLEAFERNFLEKPAENAQTPDDPNGDSPGADATP